MDKMSAKEFRELLISSSSTDKNDSKVFAKRRPKANTNGRKAGRSQTMNKTEQAYANYLEKKKLAGEIDHYDFEPFKLRLAHRTFYEFDFLVITKNGSIQIHEVKGHWEDDARVKFKVAAEKHWYFQFIAVQNKQGTWVQERLR